MNLEENEKRKSIAVWHVWSGFYQLFLFIFLASLGAASSGWAQSGFSTGTVRGTVSDARGGVIPNATVTITNAATSVKRTIVTSAEGTFQALSLNPGSYTVEVDAEGFSKLIAEQVEVTVGQSVIYDARLKVGTSNTTIEVMGNSTPLIDTAQAQQANTIDERQEINLPNVSRNYAATIYTLPGVVDSTTPSIQDLNVGTGYQSSGFSFGGGNGRANLFTIDGGQNDFGSGAQRVAHVPQDSVQEFQVNRNSFAAEFGFTVGSAINVVTKSGTNKFHGDAFGYFHDQHTDAVNYFNSFDPATAGTKPFEQSAIFGGTIGGPIKRDRLFFFTSFERQKLDSAVTTNLIGTAAAQGVGGQSNGFDGTSCPAPVTQACYLTQLALTGPNANLRGLGGFFYGSSIFSPIKDPLYSALISGNSGTFNGNAGGVAVQAPPSANGRYNNWVSRLDYQPNQTNSYSLRFSLSRESNQVIGAGGVPRFTSVLQTIRDYTITGSWNHVFNPNLVNTVRVQIVPQNSSDNVAPHPGGVEFDLGSLGIVVSPFSFPYHQLQNQYQFDDDLALAKGTHNLKFGGSYRPVQYDISQGFLIGGQYQYFDGAVPLIGIVPAALQGSLVGFNLANGYAPTGPSSTNLTASQLYVAGLPLAVLQGTGNTRYNATTNPFGVYAQDSWKATHNLTLNYGGRLDIDSEPNGYPTSYFGSPRVGVAWDPFGTGKTVVRAGGGLFTAPVLFIVPFTSTILNGDAKHISVNVVSAPAGIPQLSGIGTFERSIATVANPNPGLNTAQFNAIAAAVGPTGVTLSPPGPNQLGGAFFSVSPNFKSQYSIQSSASVAQELVPSLSLEVGYLYYRGVHIQQIQEANYQRDPTQAIDPFVGPFYAPRPGSTFGTLNKNIIQNDSTTAAGNSTYNALTSSLTKRYGHGLQAQINYTWSKSIDNTSDFSSGSAPFRPDLLSADRAISSFNVTHSFNASAVYTSPTRHSADKLVSLLYSDFILSPFVSVRSGVPFTLLVPGMRPNGTNSAHTGEIRPYNEPRNSGIGPGAARFDMRISRDVYLKRDGGVKLQLIAQAQNVLNKTNFTSVQNTFPYSVGTDPVTGRTTSSVVVTPEGNVDLLHGPYRYRGFKPNGAAQLTSPLAFKSAAPPRQISFGLELSF